MENVIIIGSGAAGLAAGIYTARAGLKPLIVSGTLPGGLLTQTSDVENFPGFPEAVNGFDLMDKCREQTEKFGAEVLYDEVKEVVLVPGGSHRIIFVSGEEKECRALIIATGSSPRYLGLEGEEKFRNRGVSACATCDGAFYKGVPVCVVGGGDSAMEEALFLTNFASEVHLIHRRDSFRASKIMADRVKNNGKIIIHYNSVVTEIFGDNEVDGVILENTVSKEKETISCKGYFAALGHVPQTELFKGKVELDEAGYLVLAPHTSHTSVEGVFGAGDCADKHYRQAITAAGMGARAAIDAERYIHSKE